ncbi:hypothetical protein [Burkholderia sp. JP2-270]|nr:hypothetical protein [Burkholderia sp. JP2-270]
MTDTRTAILAGKCALVTGASRGIGRMSLPPPAIPAYAHPHTDPTGL